MSNKKDEWFVKSYLMVAEQGIESLSVNLIARTVGKSKSSFYHYFGDLEMFKVALLEYHLQQATAFAEDINACQCVFPDIIDTFTNRKIDLLFHKQLRVKRKDPIFSQYIEKTYKCVEDAAMDLWTLHFGLENQKLFSRKFFAFVSEHFLFSMTIENYDAEWLVSYLEKIADLLSEMRMFKP
ncbi:MAG: TetR/AcrR family transcriptional regulator [Bacteroidota bacterium]